uniref:Uncharacterized protein n=1 Tax=Cannabis sativa TaxID=3483 RepID=A0A803QH16_CANSA
MQIPASVLCIPSSNIYNQPRLRVESSSSSKSSISSFDDWEVSSDKAKLFVPFVQHHYYLDCIGGSVYRQFLWEYNKGLRPTRHLTGLTVADHPLSRRLPSSINVARTMQTYCRIGPDDSEFVLLMAMSQGPHNNSSDGEEVLPTGNVEVQEVLNQGRYDRYVVMSFRGYEGYTKGGQPITARGEYGLYGDGDTKEDASVVKKPMPKKPILVRDAEESAPPNIQHVVGKEKATVEEDIDDSSDDDVPEEYKVTVDDPPCVSVSSRTTKTSKDLPPPPAPVQISKGKTYTPIPVEMKRAEEVEYIYSQTKALAKQFAIDNSELVKVQQELVEKDLILEQVNKDLLEAKKKVDELERQIADTPSVEKLEKNLEASTK